MKTILFFIAGILAMAYALNAGLSASEVSECNSLVKQSHEYTQWYSTANERAQCEAHGIKLNAYYIGNTQK